MSQLDERDLSCPQRLVWAVTINLLLRLLPTQNLFHMLIVQKTPSPPSPSSMGRIISPGEGRRRLSYERMHNGKSLTERQLPLYRSMPRTQLPTKLASLMHRGFESQGRTLSLGSSLHPTKSKNSCGQFSVRDSGSYSCIFDSSSACYKRCPTSLSGFDYYIVTECEFL